MPRSSCAPHQGSTPCTATHRASQQFVQQRPKAPPVTGFRQLRNAPHLCRNKNIHVPGLTQEGWSPLCPSSRTPPPPSVIRSPAAQPTEAPKISAPPLLAWGTVEIVQGLPAVVGLHLGPLAKIREPDVTFSASGCREEKGWTKIVVSGHRAGGSGEGTPGHPPAGTKQEPVATVGRASLGPGPRRPRDNQAF